MPSLPDFPGKGLIEGATKRTWVVVTAAGAGAVAVGGFVVKRVLGHGDGGTGASADPIAETPPAPPAAERKPIPKAKPRPAKPKAAKPEPPKPKADKPAKPEADRAKPAPEPKTSKPPVATSTDAPPKPEAPEPPTTGTDAPPKPDAEPGKITGGKDPHHALNNPVVDDPDMTEYPDPYDAREDPRDPPDPDAAPFGEEPHPQTGAESTSEPPLEQDPELERGGKPPRREKLDD